MAASGLDGAIAEMMSKPIQLRGTGMRKTKSGRMLLPPRGESGIQSDRPQADDDGTTMVGMRRLRKPARRAEPPKELSELEKVREKMAKKMQARLREMEEQDVADSWDEPSEEGSSSSPAELARQSLIHYV